MGSLASELRPIASDLSAGPRVYVDANIPWGAVEFMRHALRWDVLFVLEEPAFRRASDLDHFHRARDLGRTLVTLDRDFCNEKRFPRSVSPGVVVFTAPDEAALRRLLVQLDQMLRTGASIELPLRGRVVELTPGA